MLVLTRKSNESIMIGDEIELTVLSVSGDKVQGRHPGAARHPRVPEGGLPRDPAGGRRRRHVPTPAVDDPLTRLSAAAHSLS